MKWVPVLFVLLFVIRGFAAYANGVALLWVSNKVVMDLRQEMFIKILSLSSSYYDDHSSGLFFQITVLLNNLCYCAWENC